MKNPKKYFDKDAAIQTSGDSSKSIHFNTLFYIGVLNYEMKNYTKAKKYFLQSLESFSEFPDANYYMALLYESYGNAALKKIYLQKAKYAIERGFKMSEDDVIFVNYPRQISIYEVKQKLKE